MLQSKVQIVNEADFEMIKKFATTPYWEEKYSDFFTEDFHLDLPYAPPGMWQNMSHEETMYYFRWMEKTVSNPRYEEPIRALATDHENIYWVFRNFEADVKWAGTEGVFKSRMPALVRVRDGKIAYILYIVLVYVKFKEPVYFYLLVLPCINRCELCVLGYSFHACVKSLVHYLHVL